MNLGCSKLHLLFSVGVGVLILSFILANCCDAQTSKESSPVSAPTEQNPKHDLSGDDSPRMRLAAVNRQKVCVSGGSYLVCRTSTSNAILGRSLGSPLSFKYLPEAEFKSIEIPHSLFGVCWKAESSATYCESSNPSAAHIFPSEDKSLDTSGAGEICTLYQDKLICRIGRPHRPKNDDTATFKKSIGFRAKSLDVATSHYCVINEGDRPVCDQYPFPEEWRRTISKPGKHTSFQFDHPVNDVAAAPLSTCIINKPNQLFCWGEIGCPKKDKTQNQEGNLTKPEESNDFSSEGKCNFSEKPVEIEGSTQHFCVITDNSNLHCWGELQVDADGRNWVRMDTGWGSVCAISEDNYLRCWGHASGIGKSIMEYFEKLTSIGFSHSNVATE